MRRPVTGTSAGSIMVAYERREARRLATPGTEIWEQRPIKQAASPTARCGEFGVSGAESEVPRSKSLDRRFRFSWLDTPVNCLEQPVLRRDESVMLGLRLAGFAACDSQNKVLVSSGSIRLSDNTPRRHTPRGIHGTFGSR